MTKIGRLLWESRCGSPKSLCFFNKDAEADLEHALERRLIKTTALDEGEAILCIGKKHKSSFRISLAVRNIFQPLHTPV